MPYVKKLKPFKRKIHFLSGTWTYKIGSINIKLRNPELTKTFVVDVSTMSGMSWDEIERREWKRSPLFGPEQVRKYIWDNLLDTEPLTRKN